MTPTARTAQLESAVGQFFAADSAAIAWPYPLYEELQRDDGIVRWEGGPATLVTRYGDVKDLMAGAYPLANDGYRYGELADANLDRLPVELRPTFLQVLDFETHFMSRKDHGEHQRLRRIASRAFTARRIEQLRDNIQGHVDDLIDDMLTRPDPDFKRDVADRLPVRVISDLIGVPERDRDLIWEWAEAIAAHFTFNAETLQRVDAVISEFSDYVLAMVDLIRRTGEGPELAKLLLDHRENDALTEMELVAMYLLILFGGSETTTNLLGNGFLALQRDREQWELLAADPSTARAAVDELLRYDAPLQALPKRAAVDFGLGSHRIRAGETIVVIMAAANRDPRKFESPDVLDLTRSNSADHLSLAFGPHFCLGGALARMEGEITFATLARRLPEIRWTEQAVTYRGSAILRAVEALPVKPGPSRAR